MYTENLIIEKSILVQVIAWCRQATSHYENQCLPISLPTYGINAPHCVKQCAILTKKCSYGVCILPAVVDLRLCEFLNLYHKRFIDCMMTSSNGKIYRVTGHSPAPGEFPAQRPVTRSFDVFYDLRLKKRLSKQSWGWWLEMLSRPLWRHRDVLIMDVNKQVFAMLSSILTWIDSICLAG